MRRLPRGLPVGMEANVMIRTWSLIEDEHLTHAVASGRADGR